MTPIRRAAVVCGVAVVSLGAACAPAVRAPAAACPVELPELVDVTALDPAPRVDVRYATEENFTRAVLPGYDVARALLRPDAAAALARVEARLRERGYGLLVWDAFRPVRATLAMVEWAERTGNEWVLDQGYVARRSGHNLGSTVDLTVVELATGEPLDMGTAFDTFSEAAHTDNASGVTLRNRELLRRAMEAEGWENYPQEWWHFSFPGEHSPVDAPLSCFAD